MQSDLYYHTFSHYLKNRFGHKVRKLALHGSFNCPNRDGTLGRGGCTFCNVSSFADEQAQERTISEQLNEREQELNQKAPAYLAYFQSYTNTYAEVEQLRALYNEALADKQVVGLCVGTRPDCVPDEVLALLQEYQDQGQEVWLELGLQTAHNDTLKRINRGHEFSAYEDALRRAQLHGIKVCTHLILGLPRETHAHALETLDRVVSLGTQGIKLHPLLIVEGSAMARSWRNHRLGTMHVEGYVASAAELIRLTPADVVFHRISAYARRPNLLAPDWATDRWKAPRMIVENLKEKGGQGSMTSHVYKSA
ncbi:TIGR01212 family radical SAM protein [Agaribacterium sp. ZY112]|uniref:TIGR01212 family radical SAM protein n=1 Tax=Agaribacterium sp. ZY112 TaxID=3233574 RepID=UPI0035245359